MLGFKYSKYAGPIGFDLNDIVLGPVDGIHISGKRINIDTFDFCKPGGADGYLSLGGDP